MASVQDPHATPDQLRFLARSADLDVLKAIAVHPNASVETLGRIILATCTAPLNQAITPYVSDVAPDNAQMCDDLRAAAFRHPKLTDMQRARVVTLTNTPSNWFPGYELPALDTLVSTEDTTAPGVLHLTLFGDLGRIVHIGTEWPRGQGSQISAWGFSDGWYILADGASESVYECGYYDLPQGNPTWYVAIAMGAEIPGFVTFLEGQIDSAWDYLDEE